MRLLRVTPLLVAVAIVAPAANRGDRVEYIGGTVGQLAEYPKGRLYATNEHHLLFASDGEHYFTVPWSQVNLVEYGQKVARRYAMAVVISPLLILSKSRRHYVTIGFADEHAGQQVMVFRVNKNDVRSLLSSLEVRTNLIVQYQDDEARQAGKGN